MSVYSNTIALTEENDYRAEIGMLGEEEHMFFVNGGTEDLSTEQAQPEMTFGELLDLIGSITAKLEALASESYVSPF
jgi:hypothetical protein